MATGEHSLVISVDLLQKPEDYVYIMFCIYQDSCWNYIRGNARKKNKNKKNIIPGDLGIT